MTQPIKFQKHYVTDGVRKVRVHYSAHQLRSGERCVTLYAKTYVDGRALGELLPEGYENNTDSMTDYFEKGRARILESSPLYPAALARCPEAA